MIFLKADMTALGRTDRSIRRKLIELFFPDPIWKFQRQLRRLEYIKNCRHDVISKVLYLYFKFLFRRHSIRLGFTIPENVFGPGLAIPHYGTIVVNANARIGANCRIHTSTNIGASGGSSKAPQIGDNVYIGPGVKIFGDIKIANNIAIGANAAVSHSFLEEGILIAGVPARLVKEFEINTIIKHLK